jgi:hypothetical protein
MQSENWTFQTRRSATVRVCTCTKWKTSIYGCSPAQDEKPHCRVVHLYKTENLTVRMCTCTRRKPALCGRAPAQDGNIAVRSAPVQDGKPHCTGLHLYKMENHIVRVCTCTRRKPSNIVLTTVKPNVVNLEHKQDVVTRLFQAARLCFGKT